MQRIKQEVFDQFEKLLKEKPIHSSESRTTTNGQPTTSWMRQVTSKIKISELARRHNIVECPVCMQYKVNFSDSHGWFACQNSSCSFKGNIVDFVEKTGVKV